MPMVPGKSAGYTLTSNATFHNMKQVFLNKIHADFYQVKCIKLISLASATLTTVKLIIHCKCTVSFPVHYVIDNEFYSLYFLI